MIILEHFGQSFSFTVGPGRKARRHSVSHKLARMAAVAASQGDKATARALRQAREARYKGNGPELPTFC